MHVAFQKISSMIPTFFWVLCIWICAVVPSYSLELEVRETVWRPGDKIEWANAHIDQSGWLSITEFRGAPSETFWIRETIHLKEVKGVDGYVLAFEGGGAFEVFFDGVLLGGSGEVSAGSVPERPGSTHFMLGLPASMVTEGEHVLALRASAANLSSAENFFVEYRLKKADAVVGEIALSMLALGAAAASALILIYFFLAGSLSNSFRPGFLAAIVVALGVTVIVAIEALGSVGLIPYTGRGLADLVAMVGAISVFLALPTYLVFRFRFARPLLWGVGIFVVFILSIPPWPTLSFDHDTRAFILLCIFGLAICAKSFRSQGRQVFPFSIALTLLLGSIIIAPQSLYIFLVFLSVFLSISFADFSRQQQLMVKQAEVTAARLEAEMLRRNIQPHFLMNSLTAITEWIETAPVEALRFVEGLAEEFRSLSKLSSKKLVLLSEEIDLCRLHLDLMGMRQRRKFALKCSGLDMDETVPPGIFHTLLENAILHNRYREPRIQFDLAFSNVSNKKSYVLTTPLGAGTPHGETSTGKGLQYVKSRLEESYPARWKFSSEREGDVWVSRISIRD